MIKLNNALVAWGSSQFNEILKKELELLNAEQLPLQQGLSSASYALDNKLSVMVISTTDNADLIIVKAGIFYYGIIAGCSCADDPTPDNEYNEYCEVQIEINKITAETQIVLLTAIDSATGNTY